MTYECESTADEEEVKEDQKSDAETVKYKKEGQKYIG